MEHNRVILNRYLPLRIDTHLVCLGLVKRIEIVGDGFEVFHLLPLGHELCVDCVQLPHEVEGIHGIEELFPCGGDGISSIKSGEGSDGIQAVLYHVLVVCRDRSEDIPLRAFPCDEHRHSVYCNNIKGRVVVVFKLL